MTLLKEHDLGTPARLGPATIDLEIDGLAVTVPEGTSIMRCGRARWHRRAEALRDRQPCRIRLMPPLPGRDRGPQRHARIVHDPCRARHEGLHPDVAPWKAPPQRDGAVHLGPSP